MRTFLEKERTITLPCFGIKIVLIDSGRTVNPFQAGKITSTLHEGVDREKDSLGLAYDAGIDGLESLILAHACAGIDVTSKAYVAGVENAVEAIGNQ
jgi:hypothetical protein